MNFVVFAWLVDRDKRSVIGKVAVENLSEKDLQIGRLWKIKGSFWRLRNAGHVGANHFSIGFEEINRHHLRARPWCHDGVWMNRGVMP